MTTALTHLAAICDGHETAGMGVLILAALITLHAGAHRIPRRDR